MFPVSGNGTESKPQNINSADANASHNSLGVTILSTKEGALTASDNDEASNTGGWTIIELPYLSIPLLSTY